jgi:hypothetical protein
MQCRIITRLLLFIYSPDHIASRVKDAAQVIKFSTDEISQNFLSAVSVLYQQCSIYIFFKFIRGLGSILFIGDNIYKKGLKWILIF